MLLKACLQKMKIVFHYPQNSFLTLMVQEIPVSWSLPVYLFYLLVFY